MGNTFTCSLPDGCLNVEIDEASDKEERNITDPMPPIKSENVQLELTKWENNKAKISIHTAVTNITKELNILTESISVDYQDPRNQLAYIEKICTNLSQSWNSNQEIDDWLDEKEVAKSIKELKIRSKDFTAALCFYVSCMCRECLCKDYGMMFEMEISEDIEKATEILKNNEEFVKILNNIFFIIKLFETIELQSDECDCGHHIKDKEKRKSV